MSVRIMSAVWESSPSEGRELLVELALADSANDAGKTWLAVESIARKARCSDRHVQASIRNFVERGSLRVYVGAGPHGTNVYQFIDPITGEAISPRNFEGVKPPTQRGEITGSEISPNPLGTVKESSSRASRKPPATIKALELTAEDLAAFSAKYPALNVPDELEQFNDYQKAAGRGYADHMAGFRNWLRRAKPNVRPQTARNFPGRSAGGPAAVTDGKAWLDYAAGKD